MKYVIMVGSMHVSQEPRNEQVTLHRKSDQALRFDEAEARNAMTNLYYFGVDAKMMIESVTLVSADEVAESR